VEVEVNRSRSDAIWSRIDGEKYVRT